MQTQKTRPSPWKVRIAIALLILLGLSAQLAVTLALRRNIKFFVPGRHELLFAATFALWSSQFAAALFCLTYSRFAAPFRQIWCTLWATTAFTLCELRVDQNRPMLYWIVTLAITSLWTGYAVFVLGRWHFGTQFDLGAASPAKRQWLLSAPVISKWLAILIPVIAGNIILNQVASAEMLKASEPTWAGALAWAIVHSLFYFPLFTVMLMRRYAWLLFSGLAIIVAGFAIYDISQVIFVNPPFALQKLQTSLISITPPLCIAFTLRFLGLRWQDAQPWPAVAQPILQPAPNPFE